MAPKWLTVEMVRVIHAHALAVFGGHAGVRDQALLESAVARPRSLLAYGDPSLFELAATLCLGIIRNHPFVDGNKRAGILSAAAILDLNGYELRPDEAELFHIVLAAAAAEVDQAALAGWMSDNVTPKTS